MVDSSKVVILSPGFRDFYICDSVEEAHAKAKRLKFTEYKILEETEAVRPHSPSQLAFEFSNDYSKTNRGETP